MNFWVGVYRFAWLILVLLVIVGLACIFIPKFREMDDLRETRTARQCEAQELEERAQDLRARQERFSSDKSYVERVAKEAGMIKPDEVLFKFTNSTSEVLSPGR